jgi:hypothetical protein
MSTKEEVRAYQPKVELRLLWHILICVKCLPDQHCLQTHTNLCDRNHGSNHQSIAPSILHPLLKMYAQHFLTIEVYSRPQETQRFQAGKGAWLPQKDGPPMRVTIDDAQQNPITKKWEYKVKDSGGEAVNGGDYISQSRLYKSEKLAKDDP